MIGGARSASEGQRDGSWARLSLVLTIGLLGAAALVYAQGYFFQDDYVFISQLGGAGVPSMAELFTPYRGHLMPAGLALTWWLQHIAPFDYGAFLSMLIAGQAAGLLLMRAVALRLFGGGAAHVVPVLVYGTSMCVLCAGSWWAAAVNAVPLQLCLLGAILIAAPRRGKARSRMRGVAVVLVMAVGLLFFEKAVLIPLLLLGVLWAVEPTARPVRAVGLVLARTPGTWAALAAVMVVFAGLFIAVGGGAEAGTAPIWGGLVTEVLSRAAATLGTTSIGGPLQWIVSFEAFAAPPALLMVIAGQCAVILVTWLTLSGSSRRGWRWLIVVTCAALLVAGILVTGRSGGAALLAIAPRYYAETAVVIALAAGGLASLAWREMHDKGRWARLVAVVIANALLLLAAASAGGLVEWLRANPSRGFVVTATDQVRGAPQGAQVLDATVPPVVMGPLLYPLNRPSRLFASLPSEVEWVTQQDSLRTLLPDGRIAAAEVDGQAALPGPEANCGWRADAASGAERIALSDTVDASIVEWSYMATREGVARIRMGHGPWQAVDVHPGVHHEFISVSGSGRTVEVEPQTAGLALCIGGATAGNPVPAP